MTPNKRVLVEYHNLGTHDIEEMVKQRFYELVDLSSPATVSFGFEYSDNGVELYVEVQRPQKV